MEKKCCFLIWPIFIILPQPQISSHKHKDFPPIFNLVICLDKSALEVKVRIMFTQQGAMVHYMNMATGPSAHTFKMRCMEFGFLGEARSQSDGWVTDELWNMLQGHLITSSSA